MSKQSDIIVRMAAQLAALQLQLDSVKSEVAVMSARQKNVEPAPVVDLVNLKRPRPRHALRRNDAIMGEGRSESWPQKNGPMDDRLGQT
jgi:hypothetical protein